MHLNKALAVLSALIIIISFVFTAVGAAGVPTEIDSARLAEKMEACSYTSSSGVKLNYRVYRSPGYDKKADNKPATLIVYFHNDSGKGDDNTAQLAERSFLHQLVSDSADMLYATNQYIVVAPQCPADKSFKDADVLGAIDELREHFSMEMGDILTAKSIVMGIGGGADGVFEYISLFAGSVDRAVTVGGTPDKMRVYNAVVVGVTLFSFGEESNDALVQLHSYVQSQGESAYVSVVRCKGNLVSAVEEALKYSEPSICEWVIKDAYESRSFVIHANCTEGGGKISVSPSSVKYGSNASVVLTVNKGYTVSRLVIDGDDEDISLLEQNSNNQYQYTYNFMGVTEEHSIMVELEAIADTGEMAGLIKTLTTVLSIVSAVLVLAAVVVFAVSAKKKV